MKFSIVGLCIGFWLLSLPSAWADVAVSSTAAGRSDVAVSSFLEASDVVLAHEAQALADVSYTLSVLKVYKGGLKAGDTVTVTVLPQGRLEKEKTYLLFLSGNAGNYTLLQHSLFDGWADVDPATYGFLPSGGLAVNDRNPPETRQTVEALQTLSQPDEKMRIPGLVALFSTAARQNAELLPWKKAWDEFQRLTQPEVRQQVIEDVLTSSTMMDNQVVGIKFSKLAVAYGGAPVQSWAENQFKIRSANPSCQEGLINIAVLTAAYANGPLQTDAAGLLATAIPECDNLYAMLPDIGTFALPELDQKMVDFLKGAVHDGENYTGNGINPAIKNISIATAYFSRQAHPSASLTPVLIELIEKFPNGWIGSIELLEKITGKSFQEGSGRSAMEGKAWVKWWHAQKD